MAELKKFLEKKGNEVYQWFAQLHLLFQDKPQTYSSDDDIITYALSYMTGAA